MCIPHLHVSSSSLPASLTLRTEALASIWATCASAYHLQLRDLPPRLELAKQMWLASTYYALSDAEKLRDRVFSIRGAGSRKARSVEATQVTAGKLKDIIAWMDTLADQAKDLMDKATEMKDERGWSGDKKGKEEREGEVTGVEEGERQEGESPLSM
ncbi:hypothetical protein MMC34_007392 [Xylographa carneopallida]|nr:hypothetical protein [Xylographa carneopallida]